MKEQSNTVQSLERAFGLLELLAEKPGGMHLMDLVHASGLHKSTVHRLLQSLIQLGYVCKTQSNNQYRLTLKILSLSGNLTEGMDLVDVVRPHLEELRTLVEETVHLVVREGADIVYVGKAEYLNSSFRMASRIGMRRGMYCTAAGKSLLACMSNSQIESIWAESDIRPHTEYTITSLEGLMRELAVIRERGYAMDNQENELGVICIAVALADRTMCTEAAISISAPAIRMQEDRVLKLSTHILEARKRIMEELN